MADDEARTDETAEPEEAERTPEAEAKPDGEGERGAERGADKARREAADLRKRLREAEAERDSLQAASMSEQEKATKRAETAEARLAAALERVHEVGLRAEVAAQAHDIGITSTKAALRLLDRDAVEFTDDGEVVEASVTKALKALAKEFPMLVRQGPADAGEGGNGDRTTTRSRPGEDRFAQDLNAALRRARR